MKKGQLIIGADAKRTPCQHKKPCSDCPWSREALPGWLGSTTAEEWIQAAHGEARIECHTLMPHQCAGAAIYRANVIKSPRDKTLLVLEPDKATVFAGPAEFLKHHNGGVK